MTDTSSLAPPARSSRPAIGPRRSRPDGLVVVCAATSWSEEGEPERALAAGLSAHRPVLYVDVRPATERPPASTRPTLEPHGDHVVVLNLPAPQTTLTRRLDRPTLLRRAIRRAVDRLGAPEVRGVVVSTLDPLFGAVGESAAVYLARGSAATGGGLTGRLRARQEASQLRDADLVVADSPELAGRWRCQGLDPLVLLPGCDPTLGSRVADHARRATRSSTTPVAGIVHPTRRPDPDLLESVLHSGCSLVVAAPAPRHPSERRLRALARRPDVHWIDPPSRDELPAVLAQVDVGLLAHRLEGGATGPFPTEALDYLAAGLPVVTSDRRAVGPLRTDLIRLAPSTRTFGELARRAAVRPDPEGVERRRRFAADNTWSLRGRRLAEAIDGVIDTQGARA